MEDILNILQDTRNLIISQSIFWKSPSFWIGTALSLIGIAVSIGAWISANNAKNAAVKAKVSLSIQKIENDLTIAKTKLQGIQKDISYESMRTTLLEIGSEIERIRSVLELDHTVDEDTIDQLRKFGPNLSEWLQNVKPDSLSQTRKNTLIFDGMENILNDSVIFLSSVIGKIQAKNLEEK